ncbi:MAG: hypothetical protein V2A79_00940 [Planctomycetota bacterium]
MTVQWLLFESRLALLALLFLVEFVLLWIWARWRTRRSRRLALGGLVAGGLLLALQPLVVTDRERIIAVCKEMAYAIEDRQIDRVGRHIASEFEVGSIDREALLGSLTRVLARVHVEKPRLSGFRVSVAGLEARATFQARCRVANSEFVQEGMLSGWELTFRKVDNRWQVIAIKPLPTPMFPHHSLDQVLHAGL